MRRVPGLGFFAEGRPFLRNNPMQRTLGAFLKRFDGAIAPQTRGERAFAATNRSASRALGVTREGQPFRSGQCDVVGPLRHAEHDRCRITRQDLQHDGGIGGRGHWS